MSKKIIGIACLANNKAIGSSGNLIFSNKNDMKFFRNTTIKTSKPGNMNAVIMGRKTYNSIPKSLKHRVNCVVSNSLDTKNTLLEGGTERGRSGELLIINTSVENILEQLKKYTFIENIYVIGGESIYKYFNDNNLFDELILTIVKVPKINYGDTFFPYINFNDYNISKVIDDTTKGIEFLTDNHCNIITKTFYLAKKLPVKINELTDILSINSQEYQYLNLLDKILKNGEMRTTRNSKTISLFGVKMNFDISKSFPLLTTKKMYWKGILKELLWFINANTNSKDLEKDKVRIWKGNSTREYLDSIGLEHYEEGECGPIYGFQWRHFNAEYKGCKADYSGKGVDQLQNIIDLIKNKPTSRRMFMTAWNPGQLDEMALPPCHISYQFYVRNDKITGEKYLDCMMYQRSGDVFLGVPFNIASTATLTYILANITDINPGKINIVIGDAHIYENHIEQVRTQLSRHPLQFPKLEISKKLDINSLDYASFNISNYNYHPSIKASMIP